MLIFQNLTTSTSDADGDFFAVVDAANAQKKLTKGNIAISGFNNDSGFIDGSALNADNLSSGTVPDARFPATLTSELMAAALTALNATQLSFWNRSRRKISSNTSSSGITWFSIQVAALRMQVTLAYAELSLNSEIRFATITSM
jgi:hypothetical protein